MSPAGVSAFPPSGLLTGWQNRRAAMDGVQLRNAHLRKSTACVVGSETAIVGGHRARRNRNLSTALSHC